MRCMARRDQMVMAAVAAWYAQTESIVREAARQQTAIDRAIRSLYLFQSSIQTNRLPPRKPRARNFKTLPSIRGDWAYPSS